MTRRRRVERWSINVYSRCDEFVMNPNICFRISNSRERFLRKTQYTIIVNASVFFFHKIVKIVKTNSAR